MSPVACYSLSDQSASATHQPMILRQSVTWNGIEYLLLYRPNGVASKGWAWVDALRSNPVSAEEAERLRDLFLEQSLAEHGRPTASNELKRLYEILLAMGATHSQIQRRLGVHRPRRCYDCLQITVDGYPGPRCKPCHEQFVRTARLRNAGSNEFSGGRMSGARGG